MKRKFIWVPRPLWLALYKEGRVPPSAQRGRLVKVGVSSDRAPELRRLVSAYKQKLQRYTESAAQDVIEDFAA